MNKRALALSLSAALSALGFVACGDDEAEDDDSSGAGASGASGSGASGGSGAAGADGGGPSAGGAGGGPGPGSGGAGGGLVQLTCEEITAEYDGLVGPTSQSCDATDICQVLNGHCSGGLGGCFHVVNSSVTQADLDALYAAWQAQDCMGPVCDCMPTPPGAGCEMGMCVPHQS
jgi:hypothetical protein